MTSALDQGVLLLLDGKYSLEIQVHVRSSLRGDLDAFNICQCGANFYCESDAVDG